MAAVTLAQLVERVRTDLNQGNQSQYGTFLGWVPDVGTPKTGVLLDDIAVQDKLHDVIAELGHEQVYLKSYDPATKAATCPPWFRSMNGTAANDDYPAGSRVVIDPVWTYWSVAQAVVSGIESLYPDLFAVKTVQLTSTPLDERYELPADCEAVLDIKLEYYGPGHVQRQISTHSVNTRGADGKRYLHINRVGLGGRPIYVTYRAKPIVPDPSNGAALWSDTGLPDSAADLPVLFAKASLIPSADASRTQTGSIEQSERAKYVQAGSGTSVSRTWMQMYESRKEDERRKLLDVFPPKLHFELNG